MGLARGPHTEVRITSPSYEHAKRNWDALTDVKLAWSMLFTKIDCSTQYNTLGTVDCSWGAAVCVLVFFLRTARDYYSSAETLGYPWYCIKHTHYKMRCACLVATPLDVIVIFDTIRFLQHDPLC